MKSVETTKAEGGANATASLGRLWSTLDVALVFAVFFLYAFSPPPSANEAHYLAKAKHYWNPQFCPRDHFLNSADAHAVFYWTFGWLTVFFSLPVVAWIGRLLTWGLLAWSWRRLSFAVCTRFGLAALSAGLFVTLLHWGHMAGEWVIGGVEAKGFAYVLVFLALEAALKNRWQKMILLLGVATSFHVLVGGWSLVAATVAWASCGSYRPPLKTLILPLCGAVLLALPGLVPALAMSMNADAETIATANEIHVFGRLGHHQLFHRFLFDKTQFSLFGVMVLPFGILVARHVVLLAAWIAIGVATPCPMSCENLGQRPLRGFVGGAILIAIIGVCLDQFLVAINNTRLAAALLKYYWFRLSDVMLPLGMALGYVAAAQIWRMDRPQLSAWMLRLAVGVVAIQLSWSAGGNWADLQRGGGRLALPVADANDPQAAAAFDNWRRACHWIRENTPPNAMFLTPRWQQTFKWYAERAEVATWKDVPQDPRSVVEWWDRIGLVYVPDVSVSGLSALTEERILELQASYGFEYVLVDRTPTSRELPWPRVYPDLQQDNQAFALYKLPPPVEQPAGQSVGQPTKASGVP